MSEYTCSCGASFDTLSEKRIHQRDECEDRVADLDVSDADAEDVADEAVDELLVCDVCGAKNDGAQDIGTDETAAGVSVVLSFSCSECGAANENTAIMGGGSA
jgi:DNA-directed RNA polymerase subunit RPC12/RpoP